MTPTNLSMKGIVCCVPATKVRNFDSAISDDQKRLIQTIGVVHKRVSKGELTSDLCVQAAERLLKSLTWDPESVDVMIFVTQTPDYQIPSTAPIIAKKLGLKKNIVSFDVNQGCAGYVQGLQILVGLLRGLGLKRALLLAGDTISRVLHSEDFATNMLFGDAGTATAIEITEDSPEAAFTSWVDGSGFRDIMICNYGTSGRNSFQHTDIGENYLKLNGPNVFSFAITRVPQLVKEFITQTTLQDESDSLILVLHQANKMINDMVEKKLGFKDSCVARSLSEFGNTSSASIPLSICWDSEKIATAEHLLLVGFGVGLNINCCTLKVESPVLEILDYV